jgi:hypothetical protein
MSSATLTPSSDVSITGWGLNGGAGSYSAALTDGTDSTFASYAGNAGIMTLKLTALPANASTITTVSITLRCDVSSTKNTPTIKAWVENAAGNAQLTATGSFVATTSFSNIAQSVTVNNGNPSAWQNATIQIESDGVQSESVAEASVTVTYSTGQTVSPVAAMLLGTWS